MQSKGLALKAKMLEGKDKKLAKVHFIPKLIEGKKLRQRIGFEVYDLMRKAVSRGLLVVSDEFVFLGIIDNLENGQFSLGFFKPEFKVPILCPFERKASALRNIVLFKEYLQAEENSSGRIEINSIILFRFCILKDIFSDVR